MRLLGSLLVCCVIALNVLFGMRGFLAEGKDFFTMKPFSDPIVHCETRIVSDASSSARPLPFPVRTYRNFPAALFTARMYLETLPLYANGIAASLRSQWPAVSVRVLCKPVNATNAEVYFFSSNP